MSTQGDNDNAAGAALAAERAKALAEAQEKGWNEPVPYDYKEAQEDRAANTDDTTGNNGKATASPEPAWLSDAAVYEWDDSFGEVGPVNPALERELFNDEYIMRAGGAIKALSFKILLEGPYKVHPVREFDEAGLHPVMLENIRLCRYNSPTPIQSYTIPAVLLGHDVVGIAQTGSGKTAAYLIPALSRLMGKAKLLSGPRSYRGGAKVRAEPLILVVCPTRELACQIFDEARRLCYRTMLRPCVVYGGAPMSHQREQLEMGCDVLIATPGRLCDFLRNMNLLSLNRLKFTVIDEADEMLSEGWEEAMGQILGGGDANVDDDHIYMMFSATFPAATRALAKQYMARDHMRVRVGRIGSTHANIKQNVIWVNPEMKQDALFDLIFSGRPCRILIFVNSKAVADKVDDFLYNKGLPTTSIHADRTQREREDALRAFRQGRAPILVATGVTARGLDIINVMHVINYDLPSAQHGGIDEYVHRIGRTARIGNEGIATSFYNDRNEDIADDLVKILVENKQDIPDFLQDRVPETIVWDDDSDHEDSGEGATAAPAGAAADLAGLSWGADADGAAADTSAQADSGFKADSGFQADSGAATVW